ncbi:NusG domain II-containing protein [Berryella intestinalis]|uniref:NusG domain II-containing protein n=1 Tax=Berryella intestinalis TaxID=1531429 RepID=UPI0006907128|nr:NusG domain II-containing protein [Berryella intestinalis]
MGVADNGGTFSADRPRSRRSFLFIAGALAAGLIGIAADRVFARADGSAEKTVEVTDGDGNVHRFPLAVDGRHSITSSLGTNTIAIENGFVRMESADCPNHDCIDQAPLCDASGAIICIPHRLIVRVISTEEGRSDSAFA